MSRLVFWAGQRLNYGGELEDFEVGGAVFPVVAPTDNYIAPACRMAVVAEIAALKFKFDGDPLPAAGSDQAHGFAIGEARLHIFDQVAELFRQNTKQEDHALFVERFVR